MPKASTKVWVGSAALVVALAGLPSPAGAIPSITPRDAGFAAPDTGGSGGAGGGGGGAPPPPPGGLGDPCFSDFNCQSGHCSRGVCCETACTGTCEACNSASTGQPSGLCRPVPVGSPGWGCGQSTCTDHWLSPGGTCDGMGACLPPPPVVESCAPYMCDEPAGVCRSWCYSDADCVAPARCTNGACGGLEDPVPPDAGAEASRPQPPEPADGGPHPSEPPRDGPGADAAVDRGTPDAGVDVDTPRGLADRSGCACSAAGGGSPASLLLLALALLPLLRPRRRP